MSERIKDLQVIEKKTLQVSRKYNHDRRENRGIRILLITISMLFALLMLVIPVVSVLVKALKEGWAFYVSAITTDYVQSALRVTLIATVIALVVNTFFGLLAAWLLTRFDFRGKKRLITMIDIPFSISPVIAGLAYIMTFGRMGWAYPLLERINVLLGTNIQIAFAIPGVVLATIFVTFPFISRALSRLS